MHERRNAHRIVSRLLVLVATSLMADEVLSALFCNVSRYSNCFLCDACRDKVVDFHWNASDPWTIVSVSDDCESTGGGGTLQVINGLVILLFISLMVENIRG